MSTLVATWLSECMQTTCAMSHCAWTNSWNSVGEFYRRARGPDPRMRLMKGYNPSSNWATTVRREGGCSGHPSFFCFNFKVFLEEAKGWNFQPSLILMWIEQHRKSNEANQTLIEEPVSKRRCPVCPWLGQSFKCCPPFIAEFDTPALKYNSWYMYWNNNWNNTEIIKSTMMERCENVEASCLL